MEYSYQQVMHRMASSKQQVASDRDYSQYVTCSTDLSQQVTFTTDLSNQDLPSAEPSQQVTCNTNTSPQVECSTNLSQPFVLSIESSQQVTDCVKQVTFNTDLSQKVTSSSDLSQQFTSSTNLSQQITPSTDSSQHVMPRTCSSQQVTASLKHIKCSKNLSQQVTHTADSSQKLALNVNTVQQVTCNITDLQNLAHIVDISQQVPSNMGSMQQLVSQMMPQVETSTISSQVVSTLAYSKQAALGTNSLQKLAVCKEPLQQCETNLICPGKINPDECLKQNTLDAGSALITPDVCSEQNIIGLCPKEIVPDVDVFQNIPPCDVKIKTELLEPYNETSVVGSVMQLSRTTDTSEVKLEPKLEETETVCCDTYIPSELFVTPKIKTDPLSTFPTVTVSLPATSSTPYSQDIKPDSSEVIDDLVPRMLPNGGHPQIMLLLSLIHVGGEFQNIDNAQAMPSSPAALVDNCATLATPMPVGGSGVCYGFVPSLGGVANPDPLHNQLQTLAVAGKLPIPRLKVNKPAPQVKTSAQKPKPKLKPENILKSALTKNIFSQFW
ncbi:hypothetical protein PR048_001332 [Dryococelus australis]|uniref:Uncharacterized protein n=1 Tax=Dryococelus australis TaxID=614101 RepID=A0ABQ9IH56_9NEOP|nr:hypothetical protein PR048_001332 [Dryococelus australis]